MEKLTRADLLSLEQYSIERKAFREKVMAHKADRKIHIGRQDKKVSQMQYRTFKLCRSVSKLRKHRFSEKKHDALFRMRTCG